jgi:hypothetical protein
MFRDKQKGACRWYAITADAIFQSTISAPAAELMFLNTKR